VIKELLMAKHNYASEQEVRWCPGCGDYAILANLQRTFAKLEIPNEQLVFISGIGCSGRLPYYLNVNGFHTIHGRAPAVATGLKIARPDLSVWVVTGDGDGFSIGTNHILHLARRNLNINVLILNNQVYGLTKGQYSPTSPRGQVTKTSPNGSHEIPFEPLKLLDAAGATFLARAIDTDAPHLQSLFEAAYQHPGTSFIEIYQNCPVFNDGVFDNLRDKKARADHVHYLTDDQCNHVTDSDYQAREPINMGLFKQDSGADVFSPKIFTEDEMGGDDLLQGADFWKV
jgi:2-oxoglutarate ferredoxin oxidoreductase subunit beta